MLSLFHADFDPSHGSYPEVAAALAALYAAVASTLPRSPAKRQRGRDRPVGHEAQARTKRLQNQVSWLNRKCKSLSGSLNALQTSKSAGSKRIAPVFLAKVAISHPAVSARGFVVWTTACLPFVSGAGSLFVLFVRSALVSNL